MEVPDMIPEEKRLVLTLSPEDTVLIGLGLHELAINNKEYKTPVLLLLERIQTEMVDQIFPEAR